MNHYESPRILLLSNTNHFLLKGDKLLFYKRADNNNEKFSKFGSATTKQKFLLVKYNEPIRPIKISNKTLLDNLTINNINNKARRKQNSDGFMRSLSEPILKYIDIRDSNIFGNNRPECSDPINDLSNEIKIVINELTKKHNDKYVKYYLWNDKIVAYFESGSIVVTQGDVVLQVYDDKHMDFRQGDNRCDLIRLNDYDILIMNTNANNNKSFILLTMSKPSIFIYDILHNNINCNQSNCEICYKHKFKLTLDIIDKSSYYEEKSEIVFI